MAKQLLFSEEARRKLSRGMETLAVAVATTLGPKGRNVALDKKFGSPTITHDGVTGEAAKRDDPVCWPWRSGRRWRSHRYGRKSRRYRSVRKVCRDGNQAEQ